MNPVRISVLASAVGLALFGMSISSDMYAAQPARTASASQASVGETVAGRYIVTFVEPGVVNYQGGTAGLDRTAPQPDLVVTNPSRKLDVNSSAVKGYEQHLADLRSVHIHAINQTLGRDINVRYTYSITRNAISADMSAAEAAAIANLPGIKSVRAVKRLRLDTFRGPKFIGADTIWDGTNVPSYASATRGEGTRVGIIDTGSYAAHPSFANDPMCGFSMAKPKLVSHDCIGSSDCTGPTPEADPGNGHGVHTASTAAGDTIDNTVNPPPLLPNGVSMSGVAPCAQVYTYKVCDTDTCDDDAITAAIQQIVVDQVDVANYSIGPTCGGGDPWQDSLDFLAAEAGDVFIAASAGNTRATCTDPTGLVANNGPWVLTVAASTQDQIAAPVLTVTGPGTPPPLTQNVALIAGSTTIPVADTTDFSGRKLLTYPTNITGCTATGAFPVDYFLNSVAIIQRGTCAFAEKINNAYTAGARTVVITNNQPGSISMDTTAVTNPDDVAAFSTYKAPGDALIAFVNPLLPAGAVGDYHKIGIGNVPGDILAGFSFRGPTQAPYANLTKPDITGPGVNIYAALTADEGNYGLLSGTSMSSPHLAGSGALVRAVHPNWSPMEVKSALQMTAKLTGVEPDEVTPWNVDEVGSGRVDLTKAALVGLTLDETPANFAAADPNPPAGQIFADGFDPPSRLIQELNLASLRDVDCGTSCSWTRTFKNRSNASSTWTLSGTDPSGYELTFNPATITVAPGYTQAVTITATATDEPTTDLSFGEVMLTADDSALPVQHLTVAIKGDSGVTGPTPTVVCENGTCNLQVDTLTTSFSGLGCASYCGFLWLNRFTPDASDYPITLTSITTIFGSGAGWNATGDHINFYVWQDDDHDPANGATLVGSYIGYTMPAPANSTVTITLPTPIVLNGPGDILIGLTNPEGNVGARPAALDGGTDYVPDRSYISNGTYVDTVAGSPPDLSSADVEPISMDVAGIPKALVVRGTGTNASGQPMTLSTAGQ